MDDNMMERQIADYMVEYGTKNTDFGMWLFEVDKLAEEFNVTEKWIREHDDGILSELYLRDEVKDVEQQWGGIDWNIERSWFGFIRISVQIISETIRKKMIVEINIGSPKHVGTRMTLYITK